MDGAKIVILAMFTVAIILALELLTGYQFLLQH